MQIMSATASWMNQRFGTSYDYKTLSGNAEIGSEYLEWLVGYFGENYFGYNYDLSDPDLLGCRDRRLQRGPVERDVRQRAHRAQLVHQDRRSPDEPATVDGRFLVLQG